MEMDPVWDASAQTKTTVPLMWPVTLKLSMFFSTPTRQPQRGVGDWNGVSKHYSLCCFHVQFEGASESKGERLTNGILTSTNYPNGYPNNEDHTQTIRVPKGNTIRMEFLDFRVEDCPHGRDSPECPDFVIVTDDDGTLLAASSDVSLEDLEIVSRTETVHVRFSTDHSISKAGWRLSWGETTIKFLPYSFLNVPHRNGWDFAKEWRFDVTGISRKLSQQPWLNADHPSCSRQRCQIALHPCWFGIEIRLCSHRRRWRARPLSTFSSGWHGHPPGVCRCCLPHWWLRTEIWLETGVEWSLKEFSSENVWLCV